MKKIIILILSIFLVTGCSINYNLTISNNIKEDVTVYEDNLENIDDDSYGISESELYDVYRTKPIPLSNNIDIMAESDEKLENIDYYKTNDISNINILGLNFDGTFTRDNYQESTLALYGNGAIKSTYQDNTFSISTDKKFKIFNQYPNLSNIKINIITDGKVTDNNADSFNENTYTWLINRSNYKNKPISLTIDYSYPSDNDTTPEKVKKSLNKATEETKEKTGIDLKLIIFITVIILIILISYLIIKIKIKNKNEF